MAHKVRVPKSAKMSPRLKKARRDDVENVQALGAKDRDEGGKGEASGQQKGDAAEHHSGGMGSTGIILGGIAVAGGAAAAALGGGGNKAPVFASPTATATVAEDASVSISVSATDKDPLTYTVSAPANGTATVSGGTVVYTPKKDFSGTDTFTVTASDGKLSSSQTVTVNVTAVNDAPVLTSGATATVAENAPTSTVIYTAAATDVDAGDAITYSLSGADAAAFDINSATGAVTLKASADFETKAVYNINVVATDKGGLAATKAVVVNVTNVDEAPVISAIATRSITVDEDSSAAFVIDATDVDTPADRLVARLVTGPANGSIVNTAAGTVYVPNANYNGADSFVIGVSDGTSTTNYTVTVTVRPVDETVSIDVSDDTVATTYSAAGDVYHFTDNSALKTNAIITGMSAGDTVDVSGASSDYSFTSVGSDIQITYNNAAAGVLNVIVLKGLAGTAYVSDEASAEAAAGWNFFNAATQPSGSGSSGTAGAGGSLDADSDGNALTQAVVTATGANNYTEDANVANYVKINGFGADDTITVSNALTSAYSFTSQGTDIRITYTTAAGVVNDITLVGVVSPGTFIGSEADAELALGRDFFKNAAVSESSTSTSLDVGTASSTATVSGAGAAVTFTDNAAANSFVKITNFTAGDVIRVTGASEAQYSFSSGDLDGDGSADDLSISYSNAGSGVVNDIQILNVVSPTAFVFDKASAVSAVGFNFITFG